MFCIAAAVWCEPTAAAEREISADERAKEEAQPENDVIAEDCTAFVRATRVLPKAQTTGDCPGCALKDAAEVLQMKGLTVDQVKRSSDSCEVVATIQAVFKSSAGGGTINGGLAGWIPLEQRKAYEAGQTPPEQQTYRVRIIYRRTRNGWRAVEFDRANAE